MKTNDEFYRPKTVFVIQNKAGGLAPRTKIYPSRGGAGNGFNSFLEGELNFRIGKDAGEAMDTLLHIWIWGAGKKVFRSWDTFGHFLDNQSASARAHRHTVLRVAITEVVYDAFMEIVDAIYDEWNVEEIEQKYV